MPVQETAVEPVASLTTDAIDFFCQVGPKTSPPTRVDGSTPVINRCGGCDAKLGWSAPQPDRWASPVACPRCGRWHLVEGRNEASLRLTESALLQLQEPNSVGAMIGASEVIEQLLASVGVDDERRGSYRRLLTLPLVGVPLTGSGQPVCEALSITLCDISSGGVGLITNRPFRSPLLALDFASAGRPGVQALAELVWRTTAEGSLRVGCRFIHEPGGGLPFVS